MTHLTVQTTSDIFSAVAEWWWLVPDLFPALAMKHNVQTGLEKQEWVVHSNFAGYILSIRWKHEVWPSLADAEVQ